MRASMDSYSTAGPLGGYIYHAKRVSTEIEDVVPQLARPRCGQHLCADAGRHTGH